MSPRRTKFAKLARQLRLAADRDLSRRARTRAARYAAALAEQLGMLPRPKACQWCRRRLPLERHHPDHDEPLAVIFLCRDCHELADGMDLGAAAG